MNQFIRHPGNCPVCNGERRDCRQAGDLIFCRGIYANPKYKFIKEDAWGFGLYIEQTIINSQSQKKREEYQRQWQLEKQRRQNEETRQRAQLLPEAERNQQYQKLLGQLELTPKHQADLIRRGLTPEQIKAGMYRSLDQWQRLSDPISNKLAGINLSGKSLNNPESGYICPIWSPEGLIIGHQLRLDHPNDGGKYKWPSSKSETRPKGATAHLPNGELPLTYCCPQKLENTGSSELAKGSSPLAEAAIGLAKSVMGFAKNAIGLAKNGSNSTEATSAAANDSTKSTEAAIGLAEGILKPWIAANKLNQLFIGAAGGNFCSSSQTLKRYLKAATQCTKTQQIIFYPDAGGIQNPHVFQRDLKTLKLIQSWGYHVQIAYWHQGFDKAVGDIDEIDLTQTPLQYLTLTEYKALRKFITPSPSITPVFTDKNLGQKEWENARTFTPHQILNVQYLSAELLNLRQNLAIRSGLGTNKTGAIEAAFNSLQFGDTGCKLLGYRNSLLLQTCERWSTKDEQGKTLKPFYLLHHDKAHSLIGDSRSRIAACVDSLLHFPDESFDEVVLFIDEIESVINHLLIGGTCLEHRPELIRKFETALKRAKQIIILDGNLTDRTVTYLEKLSGKTFNKVENHYKKPRTIEFLMGSFDENGNLRPNDRKALEAQILESTGPIFIATDSQIEAELWEKKLKDKIWPNNRGGIRIDSITVADTGIEGARARKFLKNPNAYIRKYQPNYIIISPSAESGVDISIANYFTDCFILSYGVLSVSSTLQLMGRCRHPEQIKVWCRPIGVFQNQKHSPIPKEVEKEILQSVRHELNAVFDAALLNPESRHQIDEIFEKNATNSTFELVAALKANLAYEKTHFRDCLIAALQASGAEIRECHGSDSNSQNSLMSQEREEIKQQKSLERYQAADISDREADSLKRQLTRPWDEQCRLDKYFLKTQLPGVELSPELFYEVSYRHRNLLQQCKLRWLIHNIQSSQKLSQKKLEAYITPGDIFLSDVRCRHQKALKLIELRLPELIQLLQSGELISNQTPLVQEIFTLSRRKGVGVALGTAPGKLTPIQWVGRLLEMVGLKLKTEGRPTTETGRVNVYSGREMSPFGEGIAEAVGRNFASQIEKLQSITQSSFEACQPDPKDNINFVGRLTPSMDVDLAQGIPSQPSSPKRAPGEPISPNGAELPPVEGVVQGDGVEIAAVATPLTLVDSEVLVPPLVDDGTLVPPLADAEVLMPLSKDSNASIPLSKDSNASIPLSKDSNARMNLLVGELLKIAAAFDAAALDELRHQCTVEERKAAMKRLKQTDRQACDKIRQLRDAAKMTIDGEIFEDSPVVVNEGPYQGKIGAVTFVDAAKGIAMLELIGVFEIPSIPLSALRQLATSAIQAYYKRMPDWWRQLHPSGIHRGSRCQI